MLAIISALAFATNCVEAQYYRIEAPSTHLKVESCRDIDEATYGDPTGTCAEHGFQESCTSCMLAIEYKVKDPSTCDQKHTQCYFYAPNEKCFGSSECPYDAKQTFPDPPSILGKISCKVLLDKQREQKWVSGFCSIGPNPALPECIKQLEAQWDKFASKCSQKVAQQKFPDPSSILGTAADKIPSTSSIDLHPSSQFPDSIDKLTCSVLLDKQRERKWAEFLCSIGPNPALPQCIQETEAQWDKFAEKCSQEHAGMGRINARRTMLAGSRTIPAWEVAADPKYIVTV